MENNQQSPEQTQIQVDKNNNNEINQQNNQNAQEEEQKLSKNELKNLIEKNDQEEEKQLNSQFQELSINEKTQTTTTTPKKLFVDILNYGKGFFSENFWNLQKPQQKISKFIKAAKNSNIDIEIFIDGSATTRSGESFKIWKNRRFREVNKCEKRVPASLGILLGDMFRKQNIKVRYSCFDECDDVIASFAQFHKADILSGDSDIASRFPGATYTVYKDYTITKNKKNPKLLLTLHHLKNSTEIQSDSRKLLLDPLPIVNEYSNILPELFAEEPAYIRGTPTSLVKYLGNPHGILQPLRQALYYHLQITKPVFETYPEYDIYSNAAFFYEDFVSADKTNIEYLKNPLEAVKYFFLQFEQKPVEINNFEWNNHLFGVYATTFDLCRLYSNESLLSLFEKYMGDQINRNSTTNKQKTQQYLKPIQILCRYCKQNFKFDVKQQKDFKKMNFQLPKTCKQCKDKQKQSNYQ